MENAYAQAILTLIDSGHAPDEAVRRVKQSLERSGRLSLFPRIARAVVRLSEKQAGRMPKLFVADEASKASAKKEVAAALSLEADIPAVIDETLIGGWRYVENGTLMDRSYKQQLLDMYHRATR